jgi:hypothetical protein
MLLPVEEMTQGELIALLWSLGFSVDRDVSTRVLRQIVADPGPGPPLPPSSFDVLRRRIHQVVRVFRKRLEIDCDGDCMFCPTAQVVRCWLLSRDALANMEGRLEETMAKTYMLQELDALVRGELYRIAAVECALDRGTIYSMGIPALKVAILEKAGAPGELEKGKAAMASAPTSMPAPAPAPAAEVGEPGDAPPDDGEGEGAPGGQTPADAGTQESPQKAKPGRKKRAPKEQQETPPAATASEAQEPQAEVKSESSLPFEKYRPEDLIVEGVRRIVRGMGGSQGGALSKEIAVLREAITKAGDASDTALNAVCARVETLEKTMVGIAASLEFLMELPDVEGDNPFDRIKDIASRLSA